MEEKPAKFKWKDCGLSLFGSDQEKQVSKESASTSTAWRGSGQDVGLQIFRLKNRSKLEKWLIEDHGKFYNSDAYIVLNTYKDKSTSELKHDVHFWVGKYTTVDDYQTIALKTVELDVLLDNKPILHREVQGQESNLLKSYFDFFTIMKGSALTGFNRTGPDSYKMRLFQIVGERKQISVFQIPFKRGNLNGEDVFVIDCGLRIYQFNGETANKDEKFKSTMYVNKIKRERKGKPRLEILEEKTTSPTHRFFKLLPDGKSREKEEPPENSLAMHRVSDTGGNMDDQEVLNGSIDRSQLKSDGVYLVETVKCLFVWIGKDAMAHERRSCMGFAHRYLSNKANPFVTVTVIKEGQWSQEFESAF